VRASSWLANVLVVKLGFGAMECASRRCRCVRCRRSCLSGACGVVAFVRLFVYPILLLVRWWQERQPRPSRYEASTSPDCQHVPPHLHPQPDPMIYDQQYLMSQGLAVTWQNPDVTILEGGVPVDPDSLMPSTTYEVVARIWNTSTNAPAIQMPVRFSYLSFGIGTKDNPIGTTKVNLGARGAPGCPTFAYMSWTTPATPGHYCLRIELLWGDDANPKNNVGQSNTQVKKLNSPHAAFEFDTANLDRTRHVYRFAPDAYALSARPSCEGRARASVSPPTAQEIKASADAARAEHSPAHFPVPPGWTVIIDPEVVALGPGDSSSVTVDITAPDGFAGSQAFNVNAFDEQNQLVGGVTLAVKS
jgi:hypothetical protein